MSVYSGIGFEVAGRHNPPLFPVGNEDTGNGFLGAIALLCGLLHRRRVGKGQLIQNPQLNAALLHTAHMVRDIVGNVLGAGRLDTLAFGISAFDRLYETDDGWVCLVAKTPAHVKGIERALGSALPHGAELLTEITPSTADSDTSHAIASALWRMKTSTALTALHREGVPALEPVGRNGFSFVHDPENIGLQRTAVTEDVDGTIVRDMHLLVRISDVDMPRHRLAPHLGQHTDEILGELGYSRERIITLLADRVVR
jgi:crotonobetainyl-CoA:carnitine CoA-transferase CaiB-like acyl-CoA transferase